MKKLSLRQRLLATLFPALLGPAQILLVGPHTIHANNRAEFAEPFSASLTYLLPALLILTLILTAIGGLLARRGLRVYIALLFAFGLASWIQGQLLVADYGLLDGQGIDWQRRAGRTPYELLLWLGLPIAGLLLWRKILDIAPFTSALLLALQGGWMVFGAAPEQPETVATWSEPPAEIFKLAEERNVIHLIFDAFQSDAFRQIVEEEPELWSRRLEGFTFFSDHAGVFPTTVMSLPAMLTGEVYRNQVPIADFTSQLLQRASLLDRLSENGFEIDIATIAPRYATDTSDHLFRITVPYVDRELHRRSTAAYLADLSLFRHAPHLLKPRIYDDQNWLLRSRFSLADRQYHAGSGRAFFSEWIDRLEVGARRPVYKQVHVGLPHLPIVLDADCAFTGVVQADREAYLDQCRCTMRLLGDFLDRLRQLDLYDRSLILITSDHGIHQPPRGYVAASGGEDWGTIAGSAMALLLVKPFDATGDLTISRAPSALSDFPATVMEQLGLPHTYPGRSVFELDEDAERQRTFGQYSWYRERWKAPYFDALHLLDLDGPLLEGDSWSYRTTVFPPGTDLHADLIEIGSSTARRHLGIGWSSAERDSTDGTTYVWATGSRAQVFLSLPGEAAELRLRYSAPDFLHPQSTEVWLDGRLLATLESSRPNRFEDAVLEIPAGPRPAVSTLELRFAKHAPPPAGDGRDQRPLAARFETITVSPR